MAGEHPDQITTPLANTRYVPKVGTGIEGVDDAQYISFDPAGFTNIEGSNVSEALSSIDQAIANIAASATQGAFPTLASWRAGAFTLPSTSPALKVTVLDNPDAHIYEVIEFPTLVATNAYVAYQLPTNYTPGLTALDIIYTSATSVASGSSTSLQVAYTVVRDTQSLSQPFTTISTPALAYPGLALRGTEAVTISSPIPFQGGDIVQFRFRSNPLTMDFTLRLLGVVWRRT